MNKWILVFLVILFVVGCNERRQVTKQELIDLTHQWKEPKVAIWYYTGSDDEYHYFKFNDLGISKEFRIKREELEIINPYTPRKEQQEWRVMPWGPMALEREET